MQVNWSDKGLRRLEDIFDEASEVSDQYAQKITESILQKTDLLADFPYIGMVEPQFSDAHREIRSILVAHYRIVYQVKASEKY